MVAVVSDSAAVGSGRPAMTVSRPAIGRTANAADRQRLLQLALAAIWLLDGVLQFQAFMFTKGFSEMLGGTSAGNPAIIADPINWSARLIAAHPVGTDATFAAVQVLIGLGIANRRTVRVALAGSIGWAVAVWWLGEGLGGVLSGGASPLNGAPGAVILYALLAVLLWPAAGRGRQASFEAARAVGLTAARTLWLILWGSLAYFALTTDNRAAQGLHDMVAGMASGEPGWLAAINRGTAAILNHHGLGASIVLAAVLVIIALGLFLPPPAAKVTVIMAIVLSLAIWVAAQDLGTILTGGGTDPNSGLLLALVALAYWPVRQPVPAAATDGELA